MAITSHYGSTSGSKDKSKKYISLVLVMYAIKLKSDTENQRCIKDHIGHNSKTWPAIPYREKETQIPEECNIFCCEEQSHDFVCHAIAYSTAKGICRMYDLEMDRYDEYVEDYGLVNKDEGFIYFFRRWESQLHDIFNVTIAEEFRTNETVVVFEWLPVFKAEWYWVKIDSTINMLKYGFDQLVVKDIREPYLEIDTRQLPYNQIYNMTILAENMKAQSEPLVVEFLTSPPPIDNMTIVASHQKADIDWVTEEGAEWFEIKLYNREDTLIEEDDEPLYYHEKYEKNEVAFDLDPVQGYVLQIRSLAYDYYGNVTEGEWLTVQFYSEFPPLTHLTKIEKDSDCDHVTYSWSNVGFNAAYRMHLLDLDEMKSVGLFTTNATKYTIPDLQNAHKYSVQVWAINEKTRGDDLSADFITLLCKPRNLHSPHQEDSALEIEWEDVVKSEKYHISVTPSPKDGFVSRELAVSQAYIEALVPGIQYTISVTAHMTRADGIKVKSRTADLFQYTKLLAAKQLCMANQNLHNSSATFTWAEMGGAEYYYMIIRECTAPPRHILRPGFAMVRGQRCPRWKHDKLKCEKIGVSWDQSSKYLMGNVSDGTIGEAPKVFTLSDQNSRVFTGLTPGHIYKVWLGGVNKQTYSEDAITHFVTRLKTTASVEHSALTHDSVHLKWESIDKANKYTIIVLTDDKKKKRVQKISVTSLETTIQKLHPNFPYIFEVMGENQISFSWPNPVHLRTLLAPTTFLSPFDVPRGEEVSSDGFIIKWSQVEGAEYYIITITGPNDYLQEQKVRPSTLEEHQLKPTGLTHNTKHEITIEAFNRFTDGSLMTRSFYTRPNTPDRFRGIAIFDDEVTVAWDLVDGITKYDIHVYDDKQHISHIIVEDGNQHTFKKLEPNQHYIFVLRAYGHIVSDAARLELYTKIEGVDYLAMNEVYDDYMVLDWKDAAGAIRYRVEFSYTNTGGDQSEKRVEYSKYSNIELLDLVPNSIYQIQVYGENANTVGMPMELTVITKLGYIKKLRQDVSMSTDTTMMIRWLQVPNADFFNIKVTNSKNNKRIQTHKIDAKEESILLKELRPQTQYDIEIQAFSSISDSYPTSFKAQTSMLESEPVIFPKLASIFVSNQPKFYPLISLPITKVATTEIQSTETTTPPQTTSTSRTTHMTTRSTTTVMTTTPRLRTTTSTTTTLTTTSTTTTSTTTSTTTTTTTTPKIYPPVPRQIKVVTTAPPTPVPLETLPLDDLVAEVFPSEEKRQEIATIFEVAESNDDQKREILSLVGNVKRFIQEFPSKKMSFESMAQSIARIKKYAIDAAFDYQEYSVFMQVFETIKEPAQTKAMLRSAFIDGNIKMVEKVDFDKILSNVASNLSSKSFSEARNLIRMVLPSKFQSISVYLIASSWSTMVHPKLRNVIHQMTDIFQSEFKRQKFENLLDVLELSKHKKNYVCSLINQIVFGQEPKILIPEKVPKHVHSFKEIEDLGQDGKQLVGLVQRLLPPAHYFELIEAIINIDVKQTNETTLTHFITDNIDKFLIDGYFSKFQDLIGLLELTTAQRDFILSIIDRQITNAPDDVMEEIAGKISAEKAAFLENTFGSASKEMIFSIVTLNPKLSNQKLMSLLVSVRGKLSDTSVKEILSVAGGLVADKQKISTLTLIIEAVVQSQEIQPTTYIGNLIEQRKKSTLLLDVKGFVEAVEKSSDVFSNYAFKSFIKRTRENHLNRQQAIHYGSKIKDNFLEEINGFTSLLPDNRKLYIEKEVFAALRYDLPPNPMLEVATMLRFNDLASESNQHFRKFAARLIELKDIQERDYSHLYQTLSTPLVDLNIQYYARVPDNQRPNSTYEITPISGFTVDFTSDVMLRLIWNAFSDKTYHISGDNRTWLVENTVNGFNWVPDLEPDTKYKFTIRATADIFYSRETVLTWRTYMYSPEVTVASRTHNRIKLTWTPVEGATQYRVQYVESDKLKSGKGRQMTRLRYQLSDSLATTIQRLDPYVKYTVYVRAERGTQIGQNGTLSSYTKLAPTQMVEITDRTDKTAQLSWQDVPGAIEYTLIYHAINPVVNEKISQKSVDTTFKLVDLLPGSTYKLQVIAEGKESTGHPKEVSFDTFLEKPTDVETVEYHTTSAEICWKPVDMAQGYTIHYASLKSEDKIARIKDINDGSCGKLTDLKPGLMYQYTISGWNEKYDGLKTRYRSASLLEAPENLEVIFHNNTAVEVSFDATTRAVDYEIAHVQHSADIHGLNSFWTVNGMTQRLHYLINKLTPFVNYDVRVIPINRVTRGYNTTVNQWTKLNPPMNFKRVKLTPNEVTLKWDDVEYAVYYRVYYQSELTNVTLLLTDYAGIVIPDLEETTLYNVTVEAVAENEVPGVRITEPVITEARTVEDLEISLIEPWRMVVEWTGTEKAIAYEVFVNSTQYNFIMRVRTNKAFIRQLEPGILQEIEVTVITELTRSQPVPVAAYTTLPIPESARIKKITHSVVATEWNQALEDWAPAYPEIFYRCQIFMDNYNVTVVNETTTDLKFKFKDLEMNTRYTVYLQTASPYTESEIREISVRTLLPDSPDLDLNTINDDSIEMSWNKTEGLDYAVWMRPLSRPGAMIVQCEIRDTDFYKVEGLVSGCLYELVIYGQICPEELSVDDDRKRIADQMFYTRLEPVEGITIVEDDTSANITWDRVPLADYYVITWWGVDDASSNMTKTSLLNDLNIEDLEPNTRYIADIGGINADTFSNKEIFEWHTKMEAMKPKLIRSEENFFHYEWDTVSGAEKYIVSLTEEVSDWRQTPQQVEHEIESNQVKFEGLKDGTQYSIRMYAENKFTTSVVKFLDAWTNLILPKVEIESFEDTYFKLLLQVVDKSHGYWVEINGFNETIRTTTLEVIEKDGMTFAIFEKGELDQGSLQEIKIKAVNHNTTSHVVDRNINLLLNTPTNVTITPADDNIYLSWNTVEKANSYRVSLEANGVFTNATTDRNYHAFHNLEPGQMYKLRIQAFNDQTMSRYAELSTFTRLVTVEHIKLIDVEPNFFVLEWNSVQGASEYLVTVVEHENVALNISEPTVMEFSTTNLTMKIDGLSPGTKHTYSVAGVNEDTLSDSRKFTFYTELEGIQNLRMEGIKHSEFIAMWSHVPNALSYETVLMDANRKELEIKSIDANIFYDNYQKFVGLAPGVKYFVSVQAFNDVTSSNALEIEQFTRLKPFDKNAVKVIENRPDGFVLSWALVEAATKYVVTVEVDPDSILGMDVQVDPKRTFTTNETEMDLEKLKPGMTYIYTVTAHNDFTQSVPFRGIKTTLLPDIQNPVVKNVTYASFSVNWKPVPMAYAYRLQLRVVDGPVMFLVEIFKPEIELRFGSVEPGVQYQLTVVGTNDRTETRPMHVKQWTKLKPIEGLQIVFAELEEDSVVLKWLPVLKAEKYQINVTYTDSKDILFVDHTNQTRIKRDQLSAGMGYKFSLAALNTNTYSEAVDIEVMTPLSKPTEFKISVFNPSQIVARWSLGDPEAPRHRRITWRCTKQEADCTCTDFQGCAGHQKLRKNRFDGERNWTPLTIKGDFITDTIELDENTVYRACIRAENPTTNQHSNSFCVTYKTGEIKESKDKNDLNRICIQREANWFEPLEQIPAILNNGNWNYSSLPNGDILADYRTEYTSTCKKIGKEYNWDLKDYIRVEQHRCTSGWYSVDDLRDEFNQIIVNDHKCSFGLHENGSPIFPAQVVSIDYCDKRNVDPKRPWVALKNVGNGKKCGCHFLKPCERWDYKPFPSFSVKNAAPITQLPAIKKPNKCLERCDDQRHRECLAIPKYKNENKRNCACKDCCLMVTFHEENGCILYSSSLNRTSTSLVASSMSSVYTNFLGDKGMSGFRLVSKETNNVASPDQPYEITLSFSYLSETCIKFVFDGNETNAIYHDVIIRKNRDYTKMKPCIETHPREEFFPIEHVIDYDLEDGEQIVISESWTFDKYGIYPAYIEIISTDDDQVGDVEKEKRFDFMIGINEFGCQYPGIKIEGPWEEGETKSHILPKSQKLILSATEAVNCEMSPGYSFTWTSQMITPESNLTHSEIHNISQSGLEIDYDYYEGSASDIFQPQHFATGLDAVIQPRGLAEGLWKINIELKLLALGINVTDEVYISVIPSPIELNILGGERRTVGHGKAVEFIAEAFDPDSGDTNGIDYKWFIRGVNKTSRVYIDRYFKDLASEFNVPVETMYRVSEDQTKVTLLTKYFPRNEVFDVIIVCSKDIREKTFRQKVVAVDGNPPDFFIKCVENCKEKLNRGQVLSLMIKCRNCARARRPSFAWKFQIHDDDSNNDEYSYEEDYYEDVEDDYYGIPDDVDFLEDVPSITGRFDQRIMKVHKNYFEPGRAYTIHVEVAMDGFDEETGEFTRQKSQNKIDSKVNLPPKDGHCTVETDSCNYVVNEFYELVPNENSTARVVQNISETECSESCCYGESLNCLAYQYSAYQNEKTGNCTLFDVTEDDETVDLVYNFNDMIVSRYNRRIFAKIEAVKGEISFLCAGWIDEGTHLTYAEAGGRQAQLMYRFTTNPINSTQEPFLLYHGPSPKTPKLSLPLGDESFYFFGLRINAEICDAYGECVQSNEILVQSLPMMGNDIGAELMNTVSGNSSKLLTASSTKNAKIVGSMIGAVSSVLNTNQSYSDDIIKTTMATLTATTAGPDRLVKHPDHELPIPAKLQNTFDIYNLYDSVDDEVSDETVESIGVAYDEADQEAREAEEREMAKQREIWKQKMQENALLFLSDTDSIVYRKRREINDVIKRRMEAIDARMRRNADYYYDDYRNSELYDYEYSNSTYSDYEFVGVIPSSDYTLMPIDEPEYYNYDDYDQGANREMGSDVKKSIKKDLMNAVGSVVDVVVSPESLLQISDAISSFTATGDDLDEETQTSGADIALKMTSNLKSFTGESDKEQMGNIGAKVMGGLSGMVGSSTPDTSALMNDKLAGTEPNFEKLAEMDRNPKEDEYFRKMARLETRKDINAKAGTAKNVTGASLTAISDVGAAVNTKQMMDEPPGAVKSGSLGITAEKVNKEDLGGKKMSNAAGVSIKMPDLKPKLVGPENLMVKRNVEDSLDDVEVIEDEEVDIQMSSLDENPFRYGDDAALMNSPVTVLNMPNGTEDLMAAGIGVEVPNNFNPDDQMKEVIFPEAHRFQISRFEIVGPGNAILFLMEPPHDLDRVHNYEVYFRAVSPPEMGEYPKHNFNFTLPNDLEIWEMDNPEIDKYKIFIPESEVNCPKYPCSWYVATAHHAVNVTNTMKYKRRRRRSLADDIDQVHHMFISTPGCRVFNSETSKWEGGGCSVDDRSTPEHTECFCKDLPKSATFSTQFFVPPNKIDFGSIWSKACISCNAGVFSFVCVSLGLWIIIAFFTHKWDKQDAIKWRLRSLIDNRRDDTHLYQLSICTGHYADSPTKSKLYAVFNGTNGSSRVRRLGTTKNAQLFDRSSTKQMLMREKQDLGELESIQIWHDNTGKGILKGWYCDQIAVTNVKNGKRWFFMIKDYLDVNRSDGKVERLVPTADPDDGTNFNNLFVSTLTTKLTDDHIWLSVFYRPNKTNFTRLQRWACCIGLLFVSMLASAMWSGKENQADMMRIGPLKLSPTSIWISFCASLITIPPVLTCITMFRRAKTKKEKVSRSRSQSVSNTHGVNPVAGTNVEENASGRGCSGIMLPWWAIYIGYGLNLIMVLVCGFFTILYSFEFGKERSNKWLLELCLSFVENILIIQPVKVILISLAIAAILRKIDNSFLDTIEPEEIVDEDKRFLDLCSFQDEVDSAPLIAPKPPSEKQLAEAKELRYKEERMVEVIYDILAYFLYICILVFLATGNKDINAYNQNEVLKNQFYYGKFESVDSVDSFWGWVNDTARINLYPKQWYNGDKMNWRERAFLEDGYSFRVGPARLRLQRGDPLSIFYLDKEPRDRCVRGEEVRGDYTPGWEDHIPDSSDMDEDNILEQAWIYRSWQELNGAPFAGTLSTHDGGGYSAELGVNQETASFIVNHLYKNAWIDHAATITFVEFTIYNSNTNLFTQVRFATEWLPGGGCVNNVALNTFRLYHYNGATGTFMLLAQIIFMCHLLYKIYSTIRYGFIKLGVKEMFTNGWLLFDVILVVIDAFIIAMYTVRLMVSDTTMEQFAADKRSFVNFDPVVIADATLGYTISFAVFFSILKFGKLLRFNQRIDMLLVVIKQIGAEWPGFFVAYSIISMAFIQAALLIWNKYSIYFRNLLMASETMLDGMLGGSLFAILTDQYYSFGAFYYLFFCFTEMFLVLNVLCAIINTSCEMGSEHLASTANEYEIMDFMFKKFKSHPALQYFSGEKDEAEVDDLTAAIQLRTERLKQKRIDRQRKKEMEALKTYEDLTKALNKLEAINLHEKLNFDPSQKYTETEPEEETEQPTRPPADGFDDFVSGLNSNKF